MIRRLLIMLLVSWLLLAAGAAEALAQGVAPQLGEGWSGPGFYLNLFKLFGSWLIFLIWVGTTDWVSRDAVALKLDYMRWNPIVAGSFFLAYVALWLVPIFWVGLPLIVISWLGSLMAYVIYRNGKVDRHERVLTPAHIRYWLAERVSTFGVRMEREAKDPHEAGVPVILNPQGAPSERDNTTRLLAARQSPGMLPARKILADALYRRADAVMLDYTQQAVNLRFFIDGVWQNGEPLDRETGDPLLETLKLLCGLRPEDRQGRQEGKFRLDYNIFKAIVFQHVDRAKEEYRKKMVLEMTKELAGPDAGNPAELEQRAKLMADERVRERFVSPIGHWTPVEKSDLGKLRGAERINPENCLDSMKCHCTLASQGTPTGERAVIQLEIQKNRFANLDEIGMRSKMQEQLKELGREHTGLLLFSAVPAGGLRTTMNVVLRTADRFMREFAAIEDDGNRYEVVENVGVTYYHSAKGESPLAVLPAVIHRDPQVLVVRDLVNAETAKVLLEQAEEHRMIITTTRAKDAVDAIYRLMALGVSGDDLAKSLRAVFNQRLVRRLCEYCKEAYAPPPQVLQQLGLPPGRVQAFYRPPQQRDEVCPECGGAGYIGRVALIEMLVVDDNVRHALSNQAKPDVLRECARKAGMRNLQEEGVVLVAKGVTSLPELIRVLKQ